MPLLCQSAELSVQFSHSDALRVKHLVLDHLFPCDARTIDLVLTAFVRRAHKYALSLGGNICIQRGVGIQRHIIVEDASRSLGATKEMADDFLVLSVYKVSDL